MAVIVHVQNNDEQNNVLEALKPLGVLIHMEEATEGQTANFYLSRMNSKLDNIGQLRWLHKLEQVGKDVANSLLQMTRASQNTLLVQRSVRKKALEKFLEHRDAQISPRVLDALSYLPFGEALSMIDHVSE